MTAAPARHRDNGVDATAGATAHAGQAGDELAARRRGALRWTLAGIWLIYLALPGAALWDDHNLVRRYVGLAALLGFGALFLATFGLGARMRQPGGRQPGGRLPWAVQAGVTGLATALTALVTRPPARRPPACSSTWPCWRSSCSRAWRPGRPWL
ncbi:MAG TPA: hypothetical protein VGA04_35255 [Streptosporangiaceae bacterium]